MLKTTVIKFVGQFLWPTLGDRRVNEFEPGNPAHGIFSEGIKRESDDRGAALPEQCMDPYFLSPLGILQEQIQGKVGSKRVPF
jgi:hypothetical protein